MMKWSQGVGTGKMLMDLILIDIKWLVLLVLCQQNWLRSYFGTPGKRAYWLKLAWGGGIVCKHSVVKNKRNGSKLGLSSKNFALERSQMYMIWPDTIMEDYLDTAAKTCDWHFKMSIKSLIFAGTTRQNVVAFEANSFMKIFKWSGILIKRLLFGIG